MAIILPKRDKQIICNTIIYEVYLQNKLHLNQNSLHVLTTNLQGDIGADKLPITENAARLENSIESYFSNVQIQGTKRGRENLLLEDLKYISQLLYMESIWILLQTIL